MTNGGSATPARKNKSRERGKLVVQPVYLALYRLHLFQGDDTRLLQPCLFTIRSKVRTYRKQSVLDLLQELPVGLVGKESYQKPQIGIQFVHRTVGFEADVGLGTRVPPTREVVPLSPVFVYTRLFFIMVFFL